MNKIDNKEIERISRELKIPYNKVFDVIESQFLFLKKTIEEPNCDEVRFRYFGLFRVRPKTKEKLKNKLNGNELDKKE